MPKLLRTPLAIAIAGLAGAFVVWLLAYQVGATRTFDGRAYEALQQWNWRAASPVGGFLLTPMLPPVYVVLCGLVLWFAWRRHGVATAVTAGAVLVLANVTSQLLKEVTAQDRPWSLTSWGSVVDVVSWPSGHATASSALVVAAVLAAPVAARMRVALLGGAWALVAGFSVVWMGWHMPSDTLGAWGVVAAVGGAGVAGLFAWKARSAPRAAAAVPSAQSA